MNAMSNQTYGIIAAIVAVVVVVAAYYAFRPSGEAPADTAAPPAAEQPAPAQ